MGLGKLDNWKRHFYSAFQSRLETPFTYGVHDCCLGAAFLIKAQTGKDVSKLFREYKTEKGAYRVIASYGSMEKMIDSIGFKKISLSRVTEGDLVLARGIFDDWEEGIGIVDLGGLNVIFPGKIGWIRVPLLLSEIAWRVE